MFLSFGKKSASSKKSELSDDSVKTVSRNTGTVVNGASDASRCSRTTVQTTAGPLLSSTKFNTTLDPSTIANVSSPGFTSRVVNCASVGSSPYHENNATHHSKYSSVGLFPQVLLERQSILPTLSPRISQKVGRTPVRVRIASPALSERRRHSFSSVPVDLVKSTVGEILKKSPSSNVQNFGQDTVRTEPFVNTPVSDYIQEASRKRIFSECQDTSNEVKKRRKKTEVAIPNPNNDIYQYRYVRAPVPVALPSPTHLDVSSQGKRAREKGSPEEQKRQRRKICNTNNAIFSSLSSSRNLLERLTAQKRKSADSSRSSSPLTPLIAKQVKEIRTVTDVKAVQCNMDSVTQHPQDTPKVSSKAMVKRSGEVKESSLTRSSSESHVTPSCDYTTKLFRKEVSSPLARSSVSKDKKQSMWIQPPEADELTCSLLDDDSKLDRPDRLRNLLACVSGKAEKSQADTLTSAASVKTTGILPSTVTGISLSTSAAPNFNGSPGASLTSALTVTVSSTCTIMTSATVTSVNGIPSSESSLAHPPAVTSSIGSVTSPLVPKTQASTSLVSSPLGSTLKPSHQFALGTPNSTAASPLTTLTSSLVNGGQTASVSTSTPSIVSVSLVPSVTGSVSTSAPGTAVTLASSFGSPSSSTSASGAFSLEKSTSSTAVPKFPFNSNQSLVSSQNNLTSSSSTSGNIFTVKTSASSLSTAHFGTSTFNSAERGDLAMKFGSVGSNAANPALAQSTSGVNPSEGLKTAFQLAPVSTSATSSNSVTSSAKPMFQMNMPANNSLQFPNAALHSTAGQANAAVASTNKSSFSFGSSAEAPKSTFQFGSNSSGTFGSAKPALPSVGSHNEAFKSTTSSGTSVVDKPSFSFGAGAPKAGFSFGSNNSGSAEVLKPTVSFGSVSTNANDAPKSAFQFTPNNIASTDAPKQTFQFTPAASGVSNSAKPTFSFGSNSNGVADVGKQSFQFGSSLSKPSEPTKPTFQFSSAANNKPEALSKPTFGSTIQSASSSPFGQASQQQTQPTFAFGSSVQSSGIPSPQSGKGAFAFGSNSSTSSTSGFGTASPFGSPSTSAFGAPASSAQSTLPSFGSLTENKPNGFGSTPSFGSSIAASTNSNGSSGTSGTFQFGGSSSAGSSNGGFSFGPKQDQAPQGFNFSASVTAVQNQSAPAPGLFSIGAGSSTTQRRTIREGRRRR